MNDAYDGLADLYLALVSPKAIEAKDISDPVMSSWIKANLPAGARILDAGCGLGFDMLALHRGLGLSRSFDVFGSDCSASMLEAAKINGAMYGIDSSHYRKVAFVDLVDMIDWHNHFDAIFASYALYTYPEANLNYDEYFMASLKSMVKLQKPDGHILFNVRNWELFKNGCHEHSYQNTHNGIVYNAHYQWTFGNNGCHNADIVMESSDNRHKRTTILFAERSVYQLIRLIDKIGLKVVTIGHHGSGASSFHTLIVRQ